MKKIILSLVILIALVLLGIKLYYSEQLKIAFNRPKYLYDGRHYLTGDEKSALMLVRNELLIARGDEKSNRWEKAVRVVPGGGIEMIGEDSLSFTTSRKGSRSMLKLRPMMKEDAEKDKTKPIEGQGDWGLYLERRLYDGDELKGMERDLLFDENGACFMSRAPIPKRMDSPGKEGDFACDDDYIYVYHNGRWLRSKLESW